MISRPTDEDRVIAGHLNLNPFLPETWPWDTIDKLKALRDDKGAAAMWLELRRMTRRL